MSRAALAFQAGEGAEICRIPLFSALEPFRLQQVLDTACVVRLGEDERLFDMGQPAKSFFYLRTGQIKLFRLSDEGAEKVIDLIEPGQTFAEAMMFVDRPTGYPVSAEAIEASEVLAFDCDNMRGLLRESVDTCFCLLACLSIRLCSHIEEIDRLTLHTATFRLISFLLDQIPPGVLEFPQVQLTTPKHLIASRLSIQPETLSRLLARLAKQGLISVNRQRIILNDVEGLRALLHQ